ncbi:lysine transporter LysE [Paenibacillus swuensis]|uniref:Lysine transporter LysE n=1 Tax=Paenibacillus swuensis TaxID=1178515 RepID=A0A172TF64_9BACL|nr:LysE family translocator [Paenibacillus swuensis]ANE45544.1 lysine transporter LysE [Paenibacillus swuensis]
MIDIGSLAAFALVSLGMVCSPGPNMIYLISRSITQGKRAGIISLLGIVTGFLVYVVATVMGLSVLFKHVPVIYDTIKWAGTFYLLWLAWNAVKPGARSILEAQTLPVERPRRLYFTGLLTSLLNPKIAVLYVTLLPQFQSPEHGSFVLQTGLLGFTQITISFMVNLLIVLFAGQVAVWFGQRPFWLHIQRWFMATVLGGLALSMATDQRR